MNENTLPTVSEPRRYATFYTAVCKMPDFDSWVNCGSPNQDLTLAEADMNWWKMQNYSDFKMLEFELPIFETQSE